MLHITVLVLMTRLVAGTFDMDLHIKSLTMPRHEFVEYFNKQNFSWQITDYNNDRNLGSHITPSTYDHYPKVSHDFRSFEDLPENFDAREKWPQCSTIKAIYDQGDCGSCWTFGTANTASDRTCIHKDIHVSLSEQDFECEEEYVCHGGNPGSAFDFWATDGLVTEECKPYNITKLNEGGCTRECVDKSIDYAKDKHFAANVYLISNSSAESIKAELFKNGPIQAAFQVFADFLDYRGGIYEHKYGVFKGGHSVRVIGYGVEKNVEYWLVANSWATGWGENGLFRVKAFAEKLEFENYLLSGIPKS